MALPRNRRNLTTILGCIEQQKCENFQQQISVVRNWVKSNSLHLIDNEHDDYAFSLSQVLERLLAYANGDGSVPHLSCGPRAYAMKAILDGLGIKNRIVDLLGFSGGEIKHISAHTLIEIYDAEQNLWTLQDPDFNIAYKSSESGEYLSLEQALHQSHYIGFDAGGYEIENQVNLDNTIAQLFEYCGLYRMSYQGGKSLLVVNRRQMLLNYRIGIGDGKVIPFDEYMHARAGDYVVEFFG